MGRKPTGRRAMSGSERQRRYRARLKAVRTKLAKALRRLKIAELEAIRESAGMTWAQVLITAR